MILIIPLLTLAIFSFILFWQANLILAQIWGAPSVYANSEAILDAFQLANLEKDQLVLDLGCGDGRSLILAAEEYGARGIGIERSLYCWLYANLRVFRAGKRKSIKILFGDFKKAEPFLRQADLIYLYLLEKVLADKEKWIFHNLKENAKIASLAFQFKNHKPTQTKQTYNLGKNTFLYVYKKNS